VNIYLDISPPYMSGSLLPSPNDTRFDWSSAVSTPSCAHRRDFVFNAGFYTDADATGAGPRFVISASTNAGRGSSLAFDNSALVGFQDFCTPPPSTAGAKVTAGGFIQNGEAKATCGLTAKANASGTPSGHLTYQDHAQGRTVKSTAITSVVVGGTCATVRGTATVNGSGAFGFEVTVCDNGEPGTDADTFSIDMSDGYANAGTLGGGNVQLH